MAWKRLSAFFFIGFREFEADLSAFFGLLGTRAVDVAFVLKTTKNHKNQTKTPTKATKTMLNYVDIQ